jgi:hypothetical protein
MSCIDAVIFTSFHFTAIFLFLMISTPNSLDLIYHIPNPFPKIAWFTGESP